MGEQGFLGLTKSWMTGRNKGIVNDPIVLTVYATGAPDLTLIDLPGHSDTPASLERSWLGAKSVAPSRLPCQRDTKRRWIQLLKGYIGPVRTPEIFHRSFNGDTARSSIFLSVSIPRHMCLTEAPVGGNGHEPTFGSNLAMISSNQVVEPPKFVKGKPANHPNCGGSLWGMC